MQDDNRVVPSPCQPLPRGRPALEAERDLLAWQKAELDDSCAEICRSLDAARTRVLRGEGYSDPAWYRRASDALAHKRRALRAVHLRMQAVDRALAALKRQEQEALERSRERLFIARCRVALDQETYLAIWREVDRAAGREGEEGRAT